ncbi:MAG: tRNA (adenosine(37)-N6)-dimethylallyltransferase MiaA [Candidatus Omnitrophica bacterium]|nr:tRNA (adenosine(37)-N6)-dimethylallyltransferase MiaA [Candidatus Omnitrophota bacterium]
MVKNHPPHAQPPKIIFIAGPTAAGKSFVAFELAQKLQSEIVSCDAMQVYKEMTISSDKASTEMRKTVPHHLLDVCSVEAPFSVARYRELALAAIKDILSRGKIPVVVGGSGMYMMALLDGIFEYGELSPDIREKLKGELEAEGLGALYERLSQVDPEAAKKIAPTDAFRITRALEVFEGTGEKISELQKKRDGLWGKYDIRIFGLTRGRDELYRRVEARIDEMFDKGLVEEVRAVLKKKMTLNAARLIGVPEVQGFLEGGYDLDRAKYLMKLNTRHYVKRQMTWFRKDQRIEWLTMGNSETLEEIVRKIISALNH